LIRFVPAHYELLDAVNLRDVRTTADVAARLNVDKAEAARQLREAEREGLVFEEFDQSTNMPADFDRQCWFLTKEGWDEWDRLDAEQAP
jgi:DNA-binding MarR family transcriptional regulator